MTTATQHFIRQDLRRLRAQAVVSVVMQTIMKHVDHANQVRPSIYGRIAAELSDFFEQDGLEIITDLHRQNMGLPPRGPDGWTAAELAALEQRRLQMLLDPMPAWQTIIEPKKGE